jgi:FrmR/RcnR family transcriptional regulator, repressor of frmRAB operon
VTAAAAERRGLCLRLSEKCQEPAASFYWYRGLPGKNCAENPGTWEERVLDTTREKTKLVNRARRIRGQIEAVERALEREISCSEMLRIITSARGAINGLMAEVLEDHIRMRVADPLREPDAERALAAGELIDIVHSYLK